jgi:hypothetical protein
VKKIILLLVIIAFAVNAMAEEDCHEWMTCPVGYTLDEDLCICLESDYPLVPEFPDEEGGLDEGGTGFGGAEPENVPEGLLNIIYTFLSTYFIWILLFIIFLIILGVISKFAGMFTR